MESDLSLLIARRWTLSEFLPVCAIGTGAGVAFLMVFGVVRRLFKRDRGPVPFQQADALKLIGVALRFLITPLFMMMAILLALARAAGRSHYRW